MAVVPFMVLSAALLGGPRQQLQQRLTAVQHQLMEVQQQQQQLVTGVQQQLAALQGQLSAVQQQQAAMQDLMLPVPETPGPASAAPTAEGCPVNWVGIDNNCYLLSLENTTWLEAKQACSVFDPRADLASIHPDSQGHVLRLLRRAASGRGIWVGLLRLHHRGGRWAWTDGTPVGYIRWGPGTPDDPRQGEQEHCAALWTVHTYQVGYLYADHQCSDQFGFLCQIRLN